MRIVLYVIAICIVCCAANGMVPSALALDGSTAKEGARFLTHPRVKAIIRGVNDQYDCGDSADEAEKNLRLFETRIDSKLAPEVNEEQFYSLALLMSCRESSLENATFRFLARQNLGGDAREAALRLEGAHFDYADPLPRMQLVESPYLGPVHSEWAIRSQPVMQALFTAIEFSSVERCNLLPLIEAGQEPRLESKNFQLTVICNFTRPSHSDVWLIKGWYYPRFDFFRIGELYIGSPIVDTFPRSIDQSPSTTLRDPKP